MSFQLQGRRKVNILISSSQFICCRVRKGKWLQLPLIVFLSRRNVKHWFFTLWQYLNFLKISGSSWPDKSLDNVEILMFSRPWQDANDNTEEPGARFRRQGASKLGVWVRNIIRSHIVSQNHIWEHDKGVGEYQMRGQKPELALGVLGWGAKIFEGSRLAHHEATRQGFFVKSGHWWDGFIFFLVGLIGLRLLLHFFFI